MFENKHMPIMQGGLHSRGKEIHDGYGEGVGSAGDQIAKITDSGMNRNRK
jgi:hypothetical protein